MSYAVSKSLHLEQRRKRCVVRCLLIDKVKVDKVAEDGDSASNTTVSGDDVGGASPSESGGDEEDTSSIAVGVG